MYHEWNAPETRKLYLLKILAAWTAAIVLAVFPVLMAVNVVTL
jgi:hypothetical protein